MVVCSRAVKIAPKWCMNICSKTHRFEPFEYLYLRIMCPHIMVDKLIQGDITTCIRIFGIWYGSNSWQNSLKPSTMPTGLMSLHMNEARSSILILTLHARLLSCCKWRACGGRWKIWVETWLFSQSSRHHSMLIWVHIFEMCPHVASGGMVS